MLHGVTHLREASRSKVAMAPAGVAVSWKAPLVGTGAGTGRCGLISLGVTFASLGATCFGSSDLASVGSGCTGSG